MTAKITLCVLCTLLLFACGSKLADRTPKVHIEGMLIENQTQMWVSAVRLLVPETGNFVSCGNIAPQSMCSTTFPEASYTGNPVEITWSQAGQIHSTGEFVLQIPDDMDDEKPAMVHVVISAPGSAGALLVQSAD